jgi:uncharacterized protein DUF3558
MISRLGSVTAIAVLSTVLLASCTDDPEPTPPSTTRTSTSSTAPQTPRDSPPVRDPLDSKDFVADPCTSLTPAQLTELKLGDAQKNRGDSAYESETGCGYSDPDPASTLVVYVNYYPKLKNGLEHVYADRPSPPSPTWTPTTIDGYPAVVTAPQDDRTRCHVYVGISDTSYFNITYYYYDWNDYDGRDTCAAATAVAAAALATIKAAN